MSSYLHARHFTLEEARRELTAIHALVIRLVELKSTLKTKGWDVTRHRYFGGMGPNGNGSFPAELEWLVEIMRGLEHRGVVVKEMDEGLIDFPHFTSGGEEVYLCWKLGEDDILFWHRIADGFAGRRSVRDL